MIVSEGNCSQWKCPYRFGQDDEGCLGKACMMWVWLDNKHTYGTCGLIQIRQMEDKLME